MDGPELTAAPADVETPRTPAIPVEETSEPAQSPAAGHSAAAHLRFWIMAVGGLALDLWSKDWAFTTLRQNGHRVVAPYLLEFQTMFNSGALFGIGQGRTTLFLLASLVALALVLWIFWQSSPRRWLLHMALGAILAGALGNMYDRAFVKLVRVPDRIYGARYFEVGANEDGSQCLYEYPRAAGSLKIEHYDGDEPPVGYVRDFLKIPTTVNGRELWPWVFNVADSLLVGGVGILAIHLWRDRKRPHKHAPAT